MTQKRSYRHICYIGLMISAISGLHSPLTIAQGLKDIVHSQPGKISANLLSQTCPKGQIIIEDDQPQCELFDTLSLIIEDFEELTLFDASTHAEHDDLGNDIINFPNVTPEHIKARVSKLKSIRKRHDALSLAASETDINRLNYDLLGYAIDKELALTDFDLTRIPFTNDSGFFNEISYTLRQIQFDKVEDYDAYIKHLIRLPRYFAQNMANMQRGIDSNFTAAAQIMPGIINIVTELSETPINSHPYFAPFLSIPDSFSPEEEDRLYKKGFSAMKSAVIPAYTDLLTFLKTDYLPVAQQTPGIHSLPEGQALYRALVKDFSTLNITPGQIHQQGLSEVTHIRKEMNHLIKQELAFNGSLSDFITKLRSDPKFYAKNERDLLKEASYIAKRIDGKLPEFFGNLPRLPYGVIPVPKELEENYTTGRYWGGNLERGHAGHYVVNTYQLSQRPLYNLPALTLHESVPGHHLQISLAQELTDVPKFRNSLFPTAYVEGWALYAEKLGVEMGIYQTPYEHFGRLTYEMWRACRLVADTGIHWKGWSRKQAEQCFTENTALSEHNIQTELDRYISWPGQAIAYKIGELKIWDLRHRAEARLKDQFDIRAFHDEILGQGGLPLEILEKRINIWIETQISTPDDNKIEEIVP